MLFGVEAAAVSGLHKACIRLWLIVLEGVFKSALERLPLQPQTRVAQRVDDMSGVLMMVCRRMS